MSNCRGTKCGCAETPVAPTQSCCCDGMPPFALDSIATPAGSAWRAGNDWTLSEWLGALRMRLDIGRMAYAIEPGVYAVGKPSADSPVMVSGNYKLSFDHLRRALKGLDAWILAIDTKGINVWCAAGKGTFGTCELISKVESCKLKDIVSHRTLIVPQLGAPGVAAHEVAKATGFKVVYGPVRAAEIPAFMAAGMKASKPMRTVEFNLLDRLAVIPVEVVHWSKWLLALFAVSALAMAVGAGDYGLAGFAKSATRLMIAFVFGVVLGPILFHWLPGRAFAIKGVFAGIIAIAAMALVGLLPLNGLANALQSGGWTLISLGMASFMMLAYTGSSPYTSLSGTRIETRIGFAFQSVAVVIGLTLLLLPLIIGKGL